MVGNLDSSTHINFTEWDVPTDWPFHNDPLYLEAYIHKKKVRRLLIDRGASINICTLKFIKAFNYSKLRIDSTKRINIKA